MLERFGTVTRDVMKKTLREARLLRFSESLMNVLSQRGYTDVVLVQNIPNLTFQRFWHYKNAKVFPKTETLIDLSDFLNCSVDELLGIIRSKKEVSQ